MWIDGDTGIRPDAGVPPLPDDEDDVPPDSRPSDEPHPPWGDPPDLDRDEPCCEVGEVVALDDIDDRIEDTERLALAFSEGEWGITWPLYYGMDRPEDAAFRRIDTDARPTTGLRMLEGFHPIALAWGNHRFAIPANGWGPNPGVLVTTSRDGALLSTTTLASNFLATDVVRHAASHAWAVIGMYAHGDDPRTRSLFTVDDRGAVHERDFGRVDGWSAHTGSVVSVASRLVTIEPGMLDLTIRSFANGSLDPLPPTVIDLGGTVGATRFRDTVIVATRAQRATGALMTYVYDPFDAALLRGPTETLRVARDARYDLAGDDEGGTIGVCWGAEGEDRGEVRFMVLDADGNRIAASVRVARGYERAPWCAVASSGRDTFVLAWGNSPWVVHNRIHATTIRVRR
jgi:hypothetical protein